MSIFDSTAASLAADRRHTSPSTPWELYHEASKISAEEVADAKTAVEDRIRSVRQTGVEQRIHRVSVMAPTASWFFHSRPRVLLPLESEDGAGFAATTAARRSVERFGEGSISREDLAFILGCGAGVTHAHPVSGAPLRAAPASGGLYELETYVVVRQVGGLAPGLYHYHANSHSLARIRGREVIAGFVDTAAIPELIKTAAACFLLVSVIGRLEWKYGQRSYRFTMINAGHSAQQLCLAATERGFAACPHGGFMDDEVAAVLGIDGVTELLAHSVAVGHAPRQTQEALRVAEAPAAGLRLRRLESLALPPQYADWVSLDGMVGDWISAVEESRWVPSREVALHLRALLPTDRTFADYRRLMEDPEVDLVLSAEAVFAFPVGWGERLRGRWRESVSFAAARVREWLGVDALPRAFVDLVSPTRVPKTDNLDRWIQRRITLPDEFRLCDEPDLGVLVHELAHAAYLPHNGLIAEGVATAIGLGSEEPAEIVRELRSAGPMPELERWIFDATIPDVGPHLCAAIAASFVAFLSNRLGRARLLRWTDSFLYPTPLEDRSGIAEAFEKHLGETPRSAIHAWWNQCP